MNKVSITIIENRKTLNLKFGYKQKRTSLSLKIPLITNRIDIANAKLQSIGDSFMGSFFENVEDVKNCFRQHYLKSFLIAYTKTVIPSKEFHTFNSLYNEVKKRARNKNIEFNIDVFYLEQLYTQQNKKCNLTGFFLSFGKKNLYKISIDRIDSSIGYVKGNIQLICLGVNYLKNTFDNEEVVEFLKQMKK